MKIGLYLQDYRKNTIKEFEEKLSAAKKAKLDLFVFPETGYTPYIDEFYCNDIESDEDREIVESRALEISEKLNCAVIIGADDSYGMIYNIYANAFAENDETNIKYYYKHTMAKDSPFLFDNYAEAIDDFFAPIMLKNKKIGMTICYDCNHSAFSRAYGKQNIDLIINSTGGNVVYKKWYKYNKVRAIENNCVNLCTMGYQENKKANSYTFGFTPNGKLMNCEPLFPVNDDWDRLGNIFIYNTEFDDGFEKDIDINQMRSKNEKGNFKFNINMLNSIIKNADCIQDNLFVSNISGANIVFCVINEKEIIRPEITLKKLYNDKLKKYNNKKYIILNRWRSNVPTSYYENILSDVLKVRAMENFCAVLLDSPNITMCYQCGDNRTSQVIEGFDGNYILDLDRMGGPETIWKNKNGMKAGWRKGFEELVMWL